MTGKKRTGTDMINPVKINPKEARNNYMTMENERNKLSDNYKKQIKEVKKLEYLNDTLTQYRNISCKEQNKKD